MNTIRLTAIYALICAMGVAFNIAALGFPQVLWVAGPAFMLGVMILSVPFFTQIFRALHTGDLPVPERTAAMKWLGIANLALIALFFVIVFVRRST